VEGKKRGVSSQAKSPTRFINLKDFEIFKDFRDFSSFLKILEIFQDF